MSGTKKLMANGQRPTANGQRRTSLSAGSFSVLKNFFSKQSFFKKSAFTLIELLVVVLIIGILAAIALPNYLMAIQKTRVLKMLPIVRSLQSAVEYCYMATGKPVTTTNCNLDQLDITLYDKNGTKITQSMLPNSTSSGVFLDNNFILSYQSNMVYYISRYPYGQTYYFRWGINPTGTCNMQGNSTVAKSIELLEKAGFKKKTPGQTGWVDYSCYPG
jgi:prepilin-type N-terminal cleavage/methylation domain-containing protein